jgi:ABC-type branched-subunit amino acid transport system permease subunit
VALLAVAYGVLPIVGSSYLFEAILTPFLALSLAAVGLNLLTGYAGQVSLGSAAFMAVGAFAAYNFNLRVHGLPLLASLVLTPGPPLHPSTISTATGATAHPHPTRSRALEIRHPRQLRAQWLQPAVHAWS